MMPVLFALTVPTELRLWLTPVWLISLGALLGLAMLMFLWGAAFLLSRVPVIGDLAEHPGRRRPVVATLTLVAFLALFVLLVGPALGGWRAAGMNVLLENVFLAVVLLLPAAFLSALAMVWFCSQRTVSEVPDAVREGPLWPMLHVTVWFAAFGILGWFVVERPRELLGSLARTPFVGEAVYSATIPAWDSGGDATAPEQHEVAVNFRKEELKRLVIVSDQRLSVDVTPTGQQDIDPVFRITGGEPYRWEATESGENPFEDSTVTALYVRNYSDQPAVVTLTVVTQPAFPEIWSVLVTAISVVAVFLLYLLQRAVMPGLSAIALATLKSELAQPLFAILMISGISALLLFIIIPYNTFGEDDKVLKDSGMTLIMVLAIIQAIWAASTSISDEIEGRTALTVLSKPIGRRSFIIGKYLGILWTVAVMFVILGSIFLLTVAWKPIYDSNEGSGLEPTWQICAAGMLGVVPGLVLAFMETSVLAAISVAISTRLPMLANFIISFSIYVLGNLTPLLVQSAVFNQLFEPVVFVAKLIAVVLPVLDHFSIQAGIAAGKSVPYDYLGWALVYCLIYGLIALLLALVLFEDRDLA